MHNSVLHAMSEEVVLAAFQAGSGEGAPGMYVRLSLSPDGGRSWTENMIVRRPPSGATRTLWTPIVHYARETQTVRVGEAGAERAEQEGKKEKSVSRSLIDRN